ncbi:MAG TPA: DUF58 domain-containing protein [Verrucomicrobiae bacterium]|nr:DUF58 domain-containing protein [Verrucomicrobiae bacterium]
MLSPRTRLIWWVTFLVVPFATIAGVLPAYATVAVLAICAFIVAVLFDAVFAFRSVHDVSVECAETVRLSKDRTSELELHFKNISPANRLLRFGLPLPRDIESPQEDLMVEIPGAGKTSRIGWTCTPRRRGNYALTRCHIEGASPLGFWSARTALPLRTEVRVYPDLMKERKNVAALFLNRGTLGIHAQRQVGKGRDFEKLREYIPGDSYEDVHWKATAKRGRPVTKIFQIERTQEIYVIIDASRLSAREVPDPADPSVHQSTLERFLSAALVLALAAERQGDLFGMLTFSDRVHEFVRARNGQAHYSLCRDSLYTLQPQSVTPDYDELFAFIRTRLRRRALLVFLTALDDPLLAESFERNAGLVCRQHLMLVNMIQPPGVRPLFTDPGVTRMDDLYRELGGHIQWQNLLELGKKLKRHGVQFSLVQNERLSADVVTQYLNVKRRQLV